MPVRALSPDNLPTVKQEEWKYTNLARAIPANLTDGDSQEILIHRTSGQNGGNLEDILFTGSDGTRHNPSLKVVLDDNQEFTLIERHEGEGAYWKNMVSEITLGDGAIFNHIRIQDDAPEAVQTNMAQITLGKDATYNGFCMNVGASMSRFDVHATLNGTGAACNLNAVHLLSGKQHGDTTIVVEHKAPHTTSHQLIRSVVDDHARSVFQGKVHVHKIAQKTDAYQLSNTLLLSKTCEMDTKPELEIYADDVKCSHGATCGQLDDNALFYMRSRGISMAEARRLLVQAFVDEVVDKIVQDAVRVEIKEKAAQWLVNAL